MVTKIKVPIVPVPVTCGKPLLFPMTGWLICKFLISHVTDEEFWLDKPRLLDAIANGRLSIQQLQQAEDAALRAQAADM